MVENRYQKWGSFEGISRDPYGLFRVRWSGAPRFGPKSVSGDLKRNSSYWKIKRGTEVEASRPGGAPVGEAGSERQPGGEDGAEIGRESESELRLSSGEFSVG